LDVPLLAKVPLQEALREGADVGLPLVLTDPSAPASQAIRQAARGIIASTPAPLLPEVAAPSAPATPGFALPVAAPAPQPLRLGTPLPMAGGS
ncbi:MAG: sodium:proton antiporter, partial [Thermoleophilaceae bacterium]